MVNTDFLCRGGLSVTFVDLSTLLGVAGSSLESSDVSSSLLVVLVVVFSSRASFKACFVALMLTMGVPVSTYYTSVCLGR